MAGHSLGEYSALVCADVIDFQDAVNIVHHVGILCSPPCLPEKVKWQQSLAWKTIKLMRYVGGRRRSSFCSNINSPGQTVIAGKASAVDKAIELCKEAGAKRALPLKVSVPSTAR
ncbi:MAG: hypothetical protein CM1200mP40_25380 [Gammaproteobacteria bacterium]|nr:MAG: hypothetical protein CM1200mP40_25380 [Gammaproteobacteria bacterium]